jgi:B12 binding protein
MNKGINSSTKRITRLKNQYSAVIQMFKLRKSFSILIRVILSHLLKYRDKWLPKKKLWPRDFKGMKTADVILIQPPAWGINTPPLAIAQLSAYLRKEGLKVFTYDLNIDLYYRRGGEYKNAWELEYSYLWENSSWVDEIWEAHRDLIDPLINAIATSPAQIIGLSVYCSSYLSARKLVREIKKRTPDKTIVLGGPHVSRFFAGNATIESNDVPVDFIVDGEGENTLWELSRAIIDDMDFGQIPGILFQKDGRAVFTGERELITDLNNLPFPNFSDFDLSLYSENKLPVASSRGCVNRCIFCNEFPFWKKFRSFSGDYIFNNIKQLKLKFPRVYYFEFHDSLVNGNIRALDRFCDLIIESGLKIQWTGQAIFRREMTY